MKCITSAEAVRLRLSVSKWNDESRADSISLLEQQSKAWYIRNIFYLGRWQTMSKLPAVFYSGCYWGHSWKPSRDLGFLPSRDCDLRIIGEITDDVTGGSLALTLFQVRIRVVWEGQQRGYNDGGLSRRELLSCRASTLSKTPQSFGPWPIQRGND